MRGNKILVTGPTGQVATPITLALAADNDVWGAARFSDPAARVELEAAGITCVPVNLAAADFSDLPEDFDYVLNLAVVRTGRWGRDLEANAEAAGLLMAHCTGARAFLHCSSAGVYAGGASDPYPESGTLGDSHRGMFPTYSIAKIAAEVVVRTMARQTGVPATIARLSVPYGDNGGWPAFMLEMMLAGQPIPVPVGGPAFYNPIHEDDFVAQIPRLLEIAAVPAVTLNWGGPQSVSIQEMCSFLGELVGVEPTYTEDPSAIPSIPCDVTLMHELVGPASVDWQDGLRRLVAARHPEAVVA